MKNLLTTAAKNFESKGFAALEGFLYKGGFKATNTFSDWSDELDQRDCWTNGEQTVVLRILQDLVPEYNSDGEYIHHEYVDNGVLIELYDVGFTSADDLHWLGTFDDSFVESITFE